MAEFCARLLVANLPMFLEQILTLLDETELFVLQQCYHVLSPRTLAHLPSSFYIPPVQFSDHSIRAVITASLGFLCEEKQSHMEAVAQMSEDLDLNRTHPSPAFFDGGTEEARPRETSARAIKKKLSQIQALRERQARGEELDAMQLEKLASEATLRQELANEATRPVPQSSLDMATIHVVEHSPPSSSDPCLQNTTTLATTTTLSTATPSFSSIASPALGPRVSQSFSVSSPLPAQPTLTSPLQAPPLSSPPLVASSPLAPCLPSPAIRPRAPSFAAIQAAQEKLLPPIATPKPKPRPKPRQDASPASPPWAPVESYRPAFSAIQKAQAGVTNSSPPREVAERQQAAESFALGATAKTWLPVERAFTSLAVLQRDQESRKGNQVPSAWFSQAEAAGDLADIQTLELVEQLVLEEQKQLEADIEAAIALQRAREEKQGGRGERQGEKRPKARTDPRAPRTFPQSPHIPRTPEQGKEQGRGQGRGPKEQSPRTPRTPDLAESQEQNKDQNPAKDPSKSGRRGGAEGRGVWNPKAYNRKQSA